MVSSKFRPREKPQRRLRRFYSQQPLLQAGDAISIQGKEFDHMIYTLRLRRGDRCLLVDSAAREAHAVIEHLGEKQAKLKVEKILSTVTFRLFPVPLCVYVGMPQKKKADEIIRMLQELGVERFFPLESERSQVRIAPERFGALIARWQKITREAAKQSGSLRLMELSFPLGLEKALEGIAPEEQILFFHPERDRKSFRDWTFEQKSNGRRIHMFFGPEGGFSDAEIRKVCVWASKTAFRNLGFIQLGENKLKVETAVITAVGAVRFMVL